MSLASVQGVTFDGTSGFFVNTIAGDGGATPRSRRRFRCRASRRSRLRTRTRASSRTAPGTCSSSWATRRSRRSSSPMAATPVSSTCSRRTSSGSRRTRRSAATERSLATETLERRSRIRPGRRLRVCARAFDERGCAASCSSSSSGAARAATASSSKSEGERLLVDAGHRTRCAPPSGCAPSGRTSSRRGRRWASSSRTTTATTPRTRRPLARALRAPLYAPRRHPRDRGPQAARGPLVRAGPARARSGPFVVEALPVPHDAPHVALRVSAGGRRFGIATDLGHATRELRAFLAGCDLVMLEANYCPHLLEIGPVSAEPQAPRGGSPRPPRQRPGRRARAPRSRTRASRAWCSRTCRARTTPPSGRSPPSPRAFAAFRWKRSPTASRAARGDGHAAAWPTPTSSASASRYLACNDVTPARGGDSEALADSRVRRGWRRPTR